ncbi:MULTISPECIES: sugar phosphate isomerase/epimerase and 4-hydroxyphenylpyruvate domain-containing protein [unclassified Halomonas]|uniref:sugar phosphate isomerase/epimerase and 4-hydroxyphenylpyruvate domain-containing protein n=1 Tax=unclassified Halomonas TaxID=2609666 RepID=UPI001CF4D0D4|nr:MULTISPECIES: sugar phosphate isomerase/epimerase and 4-hydroxyphenylpyruvate domain-containing protein [unclassified Halomonas]MCA8864352.1 sugar phosphate isomerase/epimerase and 4-hydroxyphenylpyruvate domain-containing protein [Halomonas sp. SBBP1]UZH10034.1 TIM barrel protein [Halomonas sp. BDJS001]
MRHSIATLSLSGTLPEKLQAIAAAGFDGFELFENDLLGFPGRPAEIRQMAEDLGLTIEIFQPFRDFEGVSPEQLERNLVRVEHKFDLMEQLGVELMLVCSNAQPGVSGDPAVVSEQLHCLAERAASRGLRVGFEALSWGSAIDRFSQAWAAIKDADHPNLGLILDSYHSLALDDDITPIAKLPGEKIFFLQLSDAPRESTRPPWYSRARRSFPGLGEYDITGFVAAVLKAGYSGPLSLEMFNDEFRAAPSGPTARAARQSLLWLEERLQADAQVPNKTGRPLFQPPEPPSLSGFARLELAVPPVHLKAVETLFGILGLAEASLHRQAPITRFAGKGFYVYLHETHDAEAVTVQVLGLDCASPQHLLMRLEDFGQATRGDDAGGGYLLTTPAGIVLRFGPETSTEGRFESAPRPMSSDCRLSGAAFALPRSLLESESGIWRHLLGLPTASSCVRHEPRGVVNRRCWHAAAGEVEIALETSTHADTSTGRALIPSADLAEQGTCVALRLEVDDVVATSQRLRAAGVATEQTSANYYHDLAAHQALPEWERSLFEEHGLRYERCGDRHYTFLRLAIPGNDHLMLEIGEYRAFNA